MWSDALKRDKNGEHAERMRRKKDAIQEAGRVHGRYVREYRLCSENLHSIEACISLPWLCNMRMMSEGAL